MRESEMQTTINLEELIRSGLRRKLREIHGQIERKQQLQDLLESRNSPAGLAAQHQKHLRETGATLYDLLHQEREIENVLRAQIRVTLTEKAQDGYRAARSLENA
jgi:hypothetical protein